MKNTLRFTQSGSTDALLLVFAVLLVLLAIFSNSAADNDSLKALKDKVSQNAELSTAYSRFLTQNPNPSNSELAKFEALVDEQLKSDTIKSVTGVDRAELEAKQAKIEAASQAVSEDRLATESPFMHKTMSFLVDNCFIIFGALVSIALTFHFVSLLQKRER